MSNENNIEYIYLIEHDAGDDNFLTNLESSIKFFPNWSKFLVKDIKIDDNEVFSYLSYYDDINSKKYNIIPIGTNIPEDIAEEKTFYNAYKYEYNDPSKLHKLLPLECWVRKYEFCFSNYDNLNKYFIKYGNDNCGLNTCTEIKAGKRNKTYKKSRRKTNRKRHRKSRRGRHKRR